VISRDNSPAIEIPKSRIYVFLKYKRIFLQFASASKKPVGESPVSAARLVFRRCWTGVGCLSWRQRNEKNGTDMTDIICEVEIVLVVLAIGLAR